MLTYRNGITMRRPPPHIIFGKNNFFFHHVSGFATNLEN